jgi:ubiquinone/menaquinone biosynthesis C-methylase UbiE
MYSVGAILAVTKLRYSKPDTKRTFKVPFGKWLPVAVVALLLALATNIEPDIILIGGLFILIGIPLYLLVALSFKPEVAKSFIDLSTFLMHYTYDYWVPLKLRKRVRRHFDEMKGKKMMELGCSVGKMSVELAKEVGPTGRVHATEVSKRSLNVAQKYAEDNGAKNIIFLLEDATQRHNLHESIMDLDGVVSIGTLGYLNKPDKVLSELHKRIKPTGKIYFVDYDHIFRIIPTQGWLSDDKKIKARFNKNGFDVDIDRESGKLWEIIHIYGKKNK